MTWVTWIWVLCSSKELMTGREKDERWVGGGGSSNFLNVCEQVIGQKKACSLLKYAVKRPQIAPGLFQILWETKLDTSLDKPQGLKRNTLANSNMGQRKKERSSKHSFECDVFWGIKRDNKRNLWEQVKCWQWDPLLQSPLYTPALYLWSTLYSTIFFESNVCLMIRAST